MHTFGIDIGHSFNNLFQKSQRLNFSQVIFLQISTQATLLTKLQKKHQALLGLKTPVIPQNIFMPKLLHHFYLPLFESSQLFKDVLWDKLDGNWFPLLFVPTFEDFSKGSSS